MSWFLRGQLGVAGIIVLFAALLAPLTAAASVTPEVDKANWLFTVSFQTGTLTPSTEGEGIATLMLTGIDPVILAFTDRPERMVALVQAPTFVDILQASTDDPPNAALAGRQSVSVQQDPVVIELRSATYDEISETLTFDVRMVQSPGASTPTESPMQPETVQGGFLFIDDVQIPVRIPVNVCGNTVNVIGQLNPAFGNTCVNA